MASPLVVAMAAHAGAGSILYVNDDAPPGGDGSSWTAALSDLQVALAASQPGSGVSQIWVAEGTYRPFERDCNLAVPEDVLDHSFHMISGVAIYGGFAGDETLLEQRDPARHVTILSGELIQPECACCQAQDSAGCGGNECEAAVCAYAPICCDSQWDQLCTKLAGVVCGDTCADLGNFKRVVTAAAVDSTGVLDGFTIRNAPSENVKPPSKSHGGGMLIQNGAPTIVGCTFLKSNPAEPGGGVRIVEGSSSFTACAFHEHEAPQGGAIYASGGATTLQDCFFASCTAHDGGAIAAVGADLALANCTFADNSTSFSDRGGAIHLATSTMEASACVFERNEADRGGSVYATQSSIDFNDCHFSQPPNELPFNAESGGGMHIEDCTAVLEGCVFDSLAAESSGGAIVSAGATSLTCVNCTFNGNSATGANSSSHDGVSGGAIASTASLPLHLTQCTFLGNHAVESNASLSWSNDSGGAISTNTLFALDCVFVDNKSSSYGGAVTTHLGPTLIERCDFVQNECIFGQGGALSTHGCVVECSFNNNIALIGGGAIDLPGTQGGAQIHSCTFGNNAALFGGGIVAFYYGEPIITNCFFDNNSAESGGAIHVTWGTLARIANCTLVGNVANVVGGVYVGDAGSVSEPASAHISNSILWNNFDSSGNMESAQAGAAPAFTLALDYSCIQGLTGSLGGVGNIGDDPMFVDPLGPDKVPGSGDEDLRLSAASPCIDAGANNVVPLDTFDLDDDGDVTEFVPLDLDGLPRFVDAGDVIDSGCGVSAIIDMGAYEFQVGTLAQPAPADLTGDGVVSAVDLASLLAQWGECDSDIACCLADFDLDGVVNAFDLASLLANWGS